MQENTQLVIGENSAAPFLPVHSRNPVGIKMVQRTLLVKMVQRNFLRSIRSFNRIFDELCTTQRETETWTGLDVLQISFVKFYLFMSFRLNNQIALN